MTPRELGEWLEHLAGDEGKDGLFAMLVAYFDESGSQNPKDVFAVGGYLATAKKWRKFSRRWTAALERYGIDPPVFHMTDFESGWEQFSEQHLADDDRIPLLQELLALIRRYTIVGVASAFPALEYKRLCEEYVPVERYTGHFAEIAASFHDPSTYCLLTCMQRLGRYCVDHRIKGQIACVFDQNQNTAHGLGQFYGRMVAGLSMKSFRETISFGSRADLVPLQAADVVAYEAMKHVKNRIIGPKIRPVRKSLKLLERDVNLSGRYYQPRELSWMFAEGRRLTREYMEVQRIAAETGTPPPSTREFYRNPTLQLLTKSGQR